VSNQDLLQQAEALFRRQHERERFPGGQMVIRAAGKELLNVSLGIARGHRPHEGDPVPVTPVTNFQVMSASKAVVAFAIAVLDDRGAVDVERPVANYIPEFGRLGKGDITVLDVLTHRSGVLVPSLYHTPDVWSDWPRVQQTIWDACPRYARGTLAYHPWEFGWILGELVERVTGKRLPDFLQEILPSHLRGLQLVVDPDTASRVARTYWLGGKHYRVAGEEVAEGFEERNSGAATLTALVPGASMITTAGTLAAFYEMIAAGGVLADGTRLLRSTTLDRYLTVNVRGYDRSLRTFQVIGRGFLIGWRGPHPYGWWNSGSCVGHGGGFCVVAFCDRATGAAIAVVTNGNRNLRDVMARFAPLSSAIRKAVRQYQDI
jgi:CubicO group peptidase (beta-lactamase class C family)